MSKLLRIIIFLPLVVSCSYTKYGLNLAVTQNTYEEKILLANQTIGTKGPGFKIGIVEEIPYFVTRINYFQTKYDTVSINNTDVEMQESGIDYSIGLKLWHFQPRLVGGYYKTSAKSLTENTEDNHSLLGLGLAYEQPLNDDHYLYVAYDILDSSQIVVSSWQRLTIGYRWNFALIGSEK